MHEYNEDTFKDNVDVMSVMRGIKPISCLADSGGSQNRQTNTLKGSGIG
jgi:hypothetical protein